jgi:hypothetical protein
MEQFTEAVQKCLRAYKAGNRDGALQGLLGLDHKVLPALITAFKQEKNVEAKAFLVNAIWQHRQQSVIPFLAEASCDPEALVWRQALDGLVALASRSALAAMRAARERDFSSPQQAEEFRHRLEEAIAQAEAAVNARHR